MSENILLDHFVIRKTNTKQYNHEIDRQDYELGRELSKQLGLFGVVALLFNMYL